MCWEICGGWGGEHENWWPYGILYRWSVGLVFAQWMAIFRIMSCVETCIEEKHGRVSLDIKKHAIGPTRVSLANRMGTKQQSWMLLLLSRLFLSCNILFHI